MTSNDIRFIANRAAGDARTHARVLAMAWLCNANPSRQLALGRQVLQIIRLQRRGKLCIALRNGVSDYTRIVTAYN